jgi:hypothetical protein
MSRMARVLRLSLLLVAAGVAGAQGLEVTMRVVDDARRLHAAVIVIGDDAVETRAEPGAPAQ